MILRRRLTRLIFTTSCVFLALAFAQIIHSEARPCATKRAEDATSTLQPLIPSESQAEKETLQERLLLFRYSFFLEYAGRENARIETEKRQGRAQIADGIDYATDLHLSDGEEQVMRSIILDASAAVIECWNKTDAAALKQSRSKPRQELFFNPELTALCLKLVQLVEITRTRLEEDLGKEFLRKLDQYVFLQFVNREGPVSSVMNIGDVARGKNAALLRTTDASPVIQKPVGERKQIELKAYSLFFQAAVAPGEVFRWVPPPGSKGRGTIPYIRIPRDKKEAVFEIVQDAGNKLRANFLQTDAAMGEYHQNNGPQPIPIPLPPEFAGLNSQFWSISRDGLARLRRVLDEEEFSSFNASVMDLFAYGMVVPAQR